MPKSLREVIPDGMYLRIDADEGTLIHYIDNDLQIKWKVIDSTRRFVPGFLVCTLRQDERNNVTEEVISLMKVTLKNVDPLAQEIRYYTQGDYFFLCSVRTQE